MRNLNYTCPKCGNRQYEPGEVFMTGSLFTKLFNVQNKKFTTVTCTRCTYTEFFKSETSRLSNVFDFFTN